jgi:hypothetical protein
MAGLSVEDKIHLISEFINRPDNGKNVSKRELRKILSEDDIQSIDEQWNGLLETKKEYATPPEELERYIEYLRDADRLNNLSGCNELESYEKALECLEETLQLNPRMDFYLDRKVSFKTGKQPQPTAEDLPRWFGSKSLHNKSSIPYIGEKSDLIKEALRKQMSKLRGEDEPEIDRERLAKRIERLKYLKSKGLA